MNPSDNYAQLKDAVLGATQQGSPDSPLGSFPELQKLYSSSFQLPQSSAGTKAQAAQTDTTVYNQQAQAQAAQDNAKALQDPSKYTQVQTADGGFKFFDPTGKEISAQDYAIVKGTTPSKVLADSQNPIDIQYQKDYGDLQNYIRNKAAKDDPTAQANAAATEALVSKNYGINLAKESPQQVIQTFMAAYPTVYGLHTTGPQGTNAFLPNNSALKNASAGAGSIGG